jgi:scyllo-inositol 2-dehydrogenase (NAD+)
MRQTKLKVGVIGCGRMGRLFAGYLTSRIPEVELAGVADIVPEAAEKTAAEFGARHCHSDYHALLNDPSIEAVIIATSARTHEDVIIAAAKAGKAIFCEKPITLKLESADRAIAAVRAAGVMMQIGFMRRFDSGHARAKAQIDAGLIGRPVSANAIGRGQRNPLEYEKPEVSGGLMIDLAIHDFDMVRWLMGDEVRQVYAMAGALVYDDFKTIGAWDNACTNLLFRRGGMANVDTSRNAVYGFDYRTEVLGPDGCITIGYLRETPTLLMTRSGATHDLPTDFLVRWRDAYFAEIAHFVDCVARDHPPLVTEVDGRAALEIAIAADRSARERRPIDLPL